MRGGALRDTVADSVERYQPGLGTVIIRHVPALECQECGEVWWPSSSIARMEDVLSGGKRSDATATVAVPAYDLAAT
jgi:YgiT-type zinc finger domain-containing protein